MSQKTPSPVENLTPFAAWARQMGFSGKEITRAGALIGLSEAQASRSNTGKRELSRTERMAMSAASAGLAPWSPDRHVAFTRVKDWLMSVLAIAPAHSAYRATPPKT